MSWVYQFEEEALRELKRLDHAARARIVKYLDSRIAGPNDPRRFGKPLGHDMHGLWRYRVADYRVIARIEEKRLLVLVVRVGHRKNVYD